MRMAINGYYTVFNCAKKTEGSNGVNDIGYCTVASCTGVQNTEVYE